MAKRIILSSSSSRSVISERNEDCCGDSLKFSKKTGDIPIFGVIEKWFEGSFEIPEIGNLWSFFGDTSSFEGISSGIGSSGRVIEGILITGLLRTSITSCELQHGEPSALALAKHWDTTCPVLSHREQLLVAVLGFDLLF